MLVKDYFRGLNSKMDPGSTQYQRFWEDVIKCIPKSEIPIAIQKMYGVHGKTLSKGAGGCECQKCSNLSDDDTDCLFKDLSPEEVVLGTLMPEMFQKYWECDLTLMILAQEHERCKALLQEHGESGVESRTKKANNAIMDRIRRGNRG